MHAVTQTPTRTSADHRLHLQRDKTGTLTNEMEGMIAIKGQGLGDPNLRLEE
jgi:hypothetical protein